MMEKNWLEKYFNGECTTEELTIILEWLHDDREDHAVLQEMMTDRWEKEQPGVAGEKWRSQLLYRLQQRLYPDAADHGIVRMTSGEAVLASPEEPTESLPVIGWRRRFLRYGVVAAIAGIAFVGASVYNYYHTRDLAAQWRSVANTSAKMKYCMLPDSTKVWLDPKSTVSWQMPLDEKAMRSVRVEGQAFFNVAKDDSHPFLVYSGPVVTKVLGTAFNVEAYAEEKDIRVCLVEGKVAVSDSAWTGKRPAEILKGGEMLTYVKDAGVIHRAPLKMTSIADWTNGYLIFSEVPVKVALERLAKLYHFSLSYDKGVNLDNDRFSTAFTKEETPYQMIRNILFITDYTCRIHGDVVEIVRK